MRTTTVLIASEALITEAGDGFITEAGDVLMSESVEAEAVVITTLPSDYSIRCSIMDRVSVTVGTDEAFVTQANDALLTEDGEALMADFSVLSAIRITSLPYDYNVRA